MQGEVDAKAVQVAREAVRIPAWARGPPVAWAVQGRAWV